jgi:hypothetical protein
MSMDKKEENDENLTQNEVIKYYIFRNFNYYLCNK